MHPHSTITRAEYPHAEGRSSISRSQTKIRHQPLPQARDRIRLKGFIETSYVDWDGLVSCVVFMPGCNFRCPFCQNAELVLRSGALPDVAFEAVRTYLIGHSDFIDGVVVTGGEPLIHEWLFELLRAIRELGMKIKLDTNGSFPDGLAECIEQRLVDYVAMDVKAPLDERYFKVTGTTVDLEAVAESIGLIQELPAYEFRTTVVPTLHECEDIIAIGKAIHGAQRYVLQQFQPRETLDPAFNAIKPYDTEELKAMAAAVREYVARVDLRGC